MKRVSLLIVLLPLVFAGAPSCVLSPKWTVTGSWSYRSGKFSTWIMELRQEGDAITGTACYGDGWVLYRDIRITGTFPMLTGTITQANAAQPFVTVSGARLEGEAIDRDAIGVSLVYDSGHRVALAFKPDPAARCTP
jgi:hypothetical protein